MTQPEPTTDEAQPNSPPANAGSQQAKAMPPGTAKPISREEIERLKRSGDQDEVSQQEIDAATGQTDDTLPQNMTDMPDAGAQDHPVRGEEEDLGISPADMTNAGG
jgi:hypothetical protein